MAAAGGQSVAAEFPYDVSYTSLGVYDSTQEIISRASVSALATLQTGDTLTLNHYNSAGSTVDSVSIPIANIVTARAAIDVTGLSAASGNKISQGWLLNQGDTLEFIIATSATTTANPRCVGASLLLTAKGNP